MKVVVHFCDSDYYMVAATPEDVAGGDYYEVPNQLYDKYTAAEEVWANVQVDLARWVREHPNEALEPEPLEGGLESMYPES